MAGSPESKKRFHERERCEKLGLVIPDWAVKQKPSKKRISKNSAVPQNWTVHEGRCQDFMHLVPKDAVLISDPPYNQGYHYDVADDALADDDYAALLRAAFHGRKSVIVHYPEETINILGPVLGPVDDVMSWVYNSNQSKQHRLACWRGCRPDWTRTPQDYKNPTDKRVRLLIAAGKKARGYDWVQIDHVKNVSKVGHPCPIPLALAERLVLASTQPDDTVCDPFCGSGTVLVAAVKHGRKAIGMELSPTYADIARKNLRVTLQTEV